MTAKNNILNNSYYKTVTDLWYLILKLSHIDIKVEFVFYHDWSWSEYFKPGDRVKYASFQICKIIVTKVRGSVKRTCVNSIFSYVVKDLCPNTGGDLLGLIKTLLIDRKKLENRPTPIGNSYFVNNECLNQELGNFIS